MYITVHQHVHQNSSGMVHEHLMNNSWTMHKFIHTLFPLMNLQFSSWILLFLNLDLVHKLIFSFPLIKILFFSPKKINQKYSNSYAIVSTQFSYSESYTTCFRDRVYQHNITNTSFYVSSHTSNIKKKKSCLPVPHF